MIFMKWYKYYFHDSVTTVLQLLYDLFRYFIIIDAHVTLLVVMLCVINLTINHLSSAQDSHLKNYKMKHLSRTISLQNLSQCRNNTRSRLIKRRIYIPQKYSSTRYLSTVIFLGVASPHLFISCAVAHYKNLLPPYHYLRHMKAPDLTLTLIIQELTIIVYTQSPTILNTLYPPSPRVTLR